MTKGQDLMVINNAKDNTEFNHVTEIQITPTVPGKTP